MINSSLFALAHSLEVQSIGFVTCTVIEVSGSTPRLQGAWMIVSQENQYGTVGGGAFEFEIITQARILLSQTLSSPNTQTIETHLVHDLGMCCGGKMKVFLQRHLPPPQLWIYGAGHVSQALVRMTPILEYKTIVVDERSEWINQIECGPWVETRNEDPVEEVRLYPPKPQDLVIVITHDHALDEDLMRLILKNPPQYVGMIGSRRKWARFHKRLSAAGITQEVLEQVHSPIGLKIGAQTPSEIAVSILGEVIQFLNPE